MDKDVFNAEIAALKKQVKKLQEQRESFYEQMLEWRGIDLHQETPCKNCGGSGVTVYASTSTWRGGIGGMAITADVCDKCWGSGVASRPWFNLRTFYAKKYNEHRT